jgi:hypothetical protein
MSRVIIAARLEETVLWQQLKRRDDVHAQTLAANLVPVCEAASDRMKAMSAYAPQYTLHDDRHLLRTTEIMALVLGGSLTELNTVELALLILGAFFHDQGMVPTAEELRQIRTSADFALYKDNWLVEHPNYGETATQLQSAFSSETDKSYMTERLAELESALLTDYLRATHAQRSSDFVRRMYPADKRLDVQGVNLSPFVADLCRSHVMSATELTPGNGFNLDEQIGTYTVNVPYLAAILRLADILDFDRDRTPELLLRSIHFTSPVSLREWEKHRCVEGWTISPDLIRFTFRSPHPVYEASAR